LDEVIGAADADLVKIGLVVQIIIETGEADVVPSDHRKLRDLQLGHEPHLLQLALSSRDKTKNPNAAIKLSVINLLNMLCIDSSYIAAHSASNFKKFFVDITLDLKNFKLPMIE
jgi:hypothetical protein